MRPVSRIKELRTTPSTASVDNRFFNHQSPMINWYHVSVQEMPRRLIRHGGGAKDMNQKLGLGFFVLLSVLGVMGVFFLSTDTASLAQVADRINCRLPPALYLYRTGSGLAHCRFSYVAIYPAYVGTFGSVGADKKARGGLGDPPFKASQ